MNSQLLYQEDITILDFEAEVVERIDLPGGRTGVVLDRSYFYPTGGGQEHDSGVIGSAKVVDVFKDDDNTRLIHVIEGEVHPGSAQVHIDAERRLRHMQHHTAQHLLTQCILRQTGCETVSANINGYTPSTLDVVATQISKTDLEQAELQANRIIYEDRLVKTYFVSPEELQSIPLRRPPKVSENIRIIEIESYDYSPCGGTHVLRTGSIGLVKVLKAERQNEKTRVYFVAGLQALEVFGQMFELLTGLANQMTISWQDIPQVLRKQADQLGLLQKELQVLQQVSVKNEAHELVAGAEDCAGVKLVRASFENRPISELRLMAEELKMLPGVIAFLTSYDGQKVSLLVTCGDSTGKDARQLLTRLLTLINGRGGGDARLAQGGGVASVKQYQTLLQHVDLG